MMLDHDADIEPISSPGASYSPLHQQLRACREISVRLAAPLSDEDQTVQAMDDASPTKWHLAHTTWFFEAFVLEPSLDAYQRFSDAFHYCFNSYYEALGPRQPRGRRGLLTRPSAQEVRDYRSHVDAALGRLLHNEGEGSELAELITLGIHHEQQHQELLLTDILALFAANPLRPAYQPARARAQSGAMTDRWFSFDGGIAAIGHASPGFAFDNERPHHEVLLQPFRLADRCVTNREWLSFMADNGYQTPSLWLADGWATVQRDGWLAPGYWEQRDDVWRQMTLEGLLPVDPDAPVSHLSYYEADAFARWSGKRLPTETEWEVAALRSRADPPSQCRTLRPHVAGSGTTLTAMFGGVWQWTQSAYQPYPGYRTPPGAVGEYNGKFMCNQQVLRGSSCLTPPGHARVTYRNFFHPHQRWQMTGVRLAEDDV